MQIVLVYAFLTFLFVAIVMFFVWRSFRNEGAFLYWSVSALITAPGWGLLALSGPELRFPFVHSLSETLLFAGHFTSFLALVFFLRQSPPKTLVVAGSILAALFLVLDVSSRALGFYSWDAVVAFSHGAVYLLMIIVLLKYQRAQDAGVVYSVSTVYALIALATFKKSFDVLTGTGDAVEITSATAAATAVNSAVVLGASMSIVVGTVALSLLAFTRSARRLSELASRDPLTLLMNRRAWHTVIDEECKRVKRSGSTFSVIMLDLDHFKDVNDKYGHAAGDKTLKVMAEVIAAQLRGVDSLSRYGGEEFLALLVDTAAADTALVAERIRLAVAATLVEFDGRSFSMTCSAGVAEYDATSDSVDTVVERADKAMYLAKSEGRNRVVIA